MEANAATKRQREWGTQEKVVTECRQEAHVKSVSYFCLEQPLTLFPFFCASSPYLYVKHMCQIGDMKGFFSWRTLRVQWHRREVDILESSVVWHWWTWMIWNWMRIWKWRTWDWWRTWNWMGIWNHGLGRFFQISLIGNCRISRKGKCRSRQNGKQNWLRVFGRKYIFKVNVDVCLLARTIGNIFQTVSEWLCLPQLFRL